VIDGVRFLPEALTVKPGDSVVWTNKDPFPHTVKSRDGAGAFESKDIQPAQSWTHTAKTSGEFAYLCTLHTTMTATLRVE
jgi:plastocyanin